MTSPDLDDEDELDLTADLVVTGLPSVLDQHPDAPPRRGARYVEAHVGVWYAPRTVVAELTEDTASAAWWRERYPGAAVRLFTSHNVWLGAGPHALLPLASWEAGDQVCDRPLVLVEEVPERVTVVVDVIHRFVRLGTLCALAAIGVEVHDNPGAASVVLVMMLLWVWAGDEVWPTPERPTARPLPLDEDEDTAPITWGDES